MKKHIPNLITCMNVTSGTVAIYMAFHGYLYVAAWLVILAMVFDFFDGFAARLLHVKSEMGKELDSLADMVSFGVMPSMLAFFLIRDLGEDSIFMYVPFLIPAFSAYRLAKFNLDERQTQSFIGLPTPSNALFWIMLVFTRYYQEEFFMTMWGRPWLLAICALVLAVLLISEIPMFSLKLTDFSWNKNALLYSFLGVIVIGFVIWGVKALSCMIPVYVLISCYDFMKKRLNVLFLVGSAMLFVMLQWMALFIVLPACLIILVVKLTVRAN